MNLIHTGQSRHFGNSLLAMGEIWGYLPPWQLIQSPADMMGGDGGSIVLTDMALSGLVEGKNAFQFLKKARMQPVDSRADLGRQGYIKHVSEFIEQATADHCVSRLAESLGKTNEAKFFNERANLVLQQWDADQKVFAPITEKDGNSVHHRRLYSLDRQTDGYTEGSPLQYSWAVPFEPEKMHELRGGRKEFSCQLDDFFTLAAQQGQVDISGNLGAASLGNEPTMHVPYLYSLAGFPSRTQFYVDKVVKELFTDTPSGLPGNDDLGQLSSWIVFSMLGFYPVNPCSGEYALGRPFITNANVSVAGGKLQLKVNNQGNDRKFVERLEWNGRSLDLAYPKLSFEKLSKGGLLEFWMTAQPPGANYHC